MRSIRPLKATGAAAALAVAVLAINAAPASATIMPSETCAVWAVWDAPPWPTPDGSSSAGPTGFQSSTCPAGELDSINPTLNVQTQETDRGVGTRWQITLPNFIDDLPLKKIWLSIFTNAEEPLDHFRNFQARAQDSALDEPFDGVLEELTETDFGLHAFFTFEPNPDRERITFACIGCGPIDSDFPSVSRIEVHTVSVAEPATLALFGLGLAGLGTLRRRKAG